ncbi:MAG TPA: cysteine dioxygenase [Streptosporangiaceae bacterium]
MNPDVSVAPEIAQLMAPLGLLVPDPHPAAVTRISVGDLARQLKLITGAPERWWHLVRFDPGQPVVVDIPVDGPYRAWLTILPPAATGSATETGERSDVITVVAGELTEPGTSPLTPGRVRVHGAGQPRRAVNTSDGYTVCVHLRAHPAQ